MATELFVSVWLRLDFGRLSLPLLLSLRSDVVALCQGHDQSLKWLKA